MPLNYTLKNDNFYVTCTISKVYKTSFKKITYIKSWEINGNGMPTISVSFRSNLIKQMEIGFWVLQEKRKKIAF